MIKPWNQFTVPVGAVIHRPDGTRWLVVSDASINDDMFAHMAQDGSQWKFPHEDTSMLRPCGIDMGAGNATDWPAMNPCRICGGKPVADELVVDYGDTGAISVEIYCPHCGSIKSGESYIITLRQRAARKTAIGLCVDAWNNGRKSNEDEPKCVWRYGDRPNGR